jgi:hypothetical protein
MIKVMLKGGAFKSTKWCYTQNISSSSMTTSGDGFAPKKTIFQIFNVILEIMKNFHTKGFSYLPFPINTFQ